jgi:hypothetical protein
MSSPTATFSLFFFNGNNNQQNEKQCDNSATKSFGNSMSFFGLPPG